MLVKVDLQKQKQKRVSQNASQHIINERTDASGTGVVELVRPPLAHARRAEVGPRTRARLQ
jgi:hypothetical protein